MLAIFWKVKNIIYFWKLDYLQIYNSYELNSIRYHSSLHSVVFVMRNRDLMCDLQCWSYMYFPWLFGGLKKNTFQLLSNEYTEYKPYHASLFVQRLIPYIIRKVFRYLYPILHFFNGSRDLVYFNFWRDCRKSRISFIKKWTNLLLISFIVNRKKKFITFFIVFTKTLR